MGELNRIIAIMGNAVVKPCLEAYLAMKGTAIWEKNGCVVAFISADLMALTNLHHPLGWLPQPKLHRWTSNEKCRVTQTLLDLGLTHIILQLDLETDFVIPI